MTKINTQNPNSALDTGLQNNPTPNQTQTKTQEIWKKWECDISQNNGELFAGLGLECVWLTADLVVAIRSVLSICQLAKTFFAGLIFLPATLVATGVIEVATAQTHMIPQAKDLLKEAKENLKNIKTLNPNSSYAEPINPSKIESFTAAFKKRVTIQKINLYNQWSFFAVGCGEIISGVGLALTQSVKAINFPAVLSGSLATTALTIIGSGLGIIYVVRGVGMMARSWMCLEVINSFQEELNNKKSPDEVEDFIRETKNNFTNNEALGVAYFSERVGHKMAVEIMSGTYSLAELDKAIHTEKCKQQVLFSVGVVTLLGGLGTFAALIFSGGTSALIVGIATSAFSLATESILVLYDSLWLTQSLAKLSYTPSKWANIPKIEDIQPYVPNQTS